MSLGVLRAPMHAFLPAEARARRQGPLELELRMAVSYHVGGRKQAWALCSKQVLSTAEWPPQP